MEHSQTKMLQAIILLAEPFVPYPAFSANVSPMQWSCQDCWMWKFICYNLINRIKFKVILCSSTSMQYQKFYVNKQSGLEVAKAGQIADRYNGQ